MSEANLRGMLTGGGPADPVQRIRDLMRVDGVAGWAKERLRILADTCDPAESHVHVTKVPPWVCRRIREIREKMETVAGLERQREEICAEFTEAWSPGPPAPQEEE